LCSKLLHNCRGFTSARCSIKFRPKSAAGTWRRPSSVVGRAVCKTKNRVIAEYALRESNRPIGIAEYQLARALPERFEASLPSIERLEQELEETAAEATHGESAPRPPVSESRSKRARQSPPKARPEGVRAKKQ
jgi:YhcG PDDEXK nuclease domain